MAYCVNLSILLCSFLSRKLEISKFFNSHANFVLNFEVSKYVTGAPPLLPLARPFQKSPTLLPIGVKAPSPVTTTRFKTMKIGLFKYSLCKKLLALPLLCFQPDHQESEY